MVEQLEKLTALMFLNSLPRDQKPKFVTGIGVIQYDDQGRVSIVPGIGVIRYE